MSHQGTWANALVKQEWSKLLIHNLKHVHTNFTYRILLIFKTHSNVMYLIYSQFPLISHLINSCEHIKWCLSSTPLESSKYLHKRQILIGLRNFRDKTMPSGVGRGGKSISYTSPPHGTGGLRAVQVSMGAKQQVPCIATWQLSLIKWNIWLHAFFPHSTNWIWMIMR